MKLTMRQKTKPVIAVFLALVFAVTSLSGCAVSPAGGAGDPSIDPFDTDRVVTVRIEMLDKDWEFCLTHPFEERYVPADFWWDDELIPDVALRPKGNSSLGQAVGWDSPRMPFAVDFNLLNKARSLHGVKKVFLNNGWSDPTLIREVVAYGIFAEMGLPTPRASLIDLSINGHHLGVYTMAEMVDATFLRNHFADASGNLYKPELVSARLEWTEEDAYKSLLFPGMSEPPRNDPILYTNIGGGPLLDLLHALGQEDLIAIQETAPPAVGNIARGLPAMFMPRNRLEAMMLKTNENNPDYTALLKFLEVLNNEPSKTFVQEIEKVLDVDQTLRFIAVSGLIVHLDNYIGAGHNNYIYEVDGKFTPIPWDTNMAFGTFNYGIRKDGLINFYIDEPTAGPVAMYPLVYKLLSYPPYMEKYRGYVKEALEGPFSLDVILPRIDRLVEMVRPYAKADTEMFYSYEDWERCLTEDLRPPDLFEGWMAGGPSPMLPFILHRAETAALQRNFGVSSLFELMMRTLTPQDIAKLKTSLTPGTFNLFLQNYYGPLMAPQPPRQPGFGPNSLGLKSFIIARHESVRQQLAGERPSRGPKFKGNGATLWMSGMFGEQ
jgi:spore coat protein CotH